MSINDEWVRYLRAEGYLGNINDMLRTALQAEAVSSYKNLNDLWVAYLTAEGYSGHINDMMYNWLGDKGYTGNINDRMMAALKADDVFGAADPISILGDKLAAWYDPSDLTTLFTTSTGETPVTAAGDPVGKWSDKSPNGRDLLQDVSGSRMKYGTDGTLRWVEGTGVSEWLKTANIDLTGQTKMTIFVATRVNTPRSNNSPIFQFGLPSGSSATSGSVTLRSGDGSIDSIRVALVGVATNQSTRLAKTIPYTSVYSVVIDAAATGAGEISLRENGSQIDVGSATDSGITSFGSRPIAVSANVDGTAPFNGRIYELVVAVGDLTTEQIEQVESYIAASAGVTI